MTGRLTKASRPRPSRLSALLLPFCLTYLKLHLASSSLLLLPSLLSFVSCKWRKHIRGPCCYELYLVSSFSPSASVSYASSKVCIGGVAAGTACLVFPFDASRHISVEQAGASWEQNPCHVSAFLRLALPTFTRYPSSSFRFSPVPLPRFQPILLER